jgi:hypothetical protein
VQSGRSLATRGGTSTAPYAKESEIIVAVRKIDAFTAVIMKNAQTRHQKHVTSPLQNPAG